MVASPQLPPRGRPVRSPFDAPDNRLAPVTERHCFSLGARGPSPLQVLGGTLRHAHPSRAAAPPSPAGLGLWGAAGVRGDAGGPSTGFLFSGPHPDLTRGSDPGGHGGCQRNPRPHGPR